MNKSLLKSFFVILVLLTFKASNGQSLNAKFGYTINCRTVTFHDSSTTTGGLKVDYCSWDFGDGGTNVLPRNPTHIYTVNDTFTVTMDVFASDIVLGGFHSTTTRQVIINCSTCNIDPEFSATRDPAVSTKMIFTNATQGQTTYNSVWDFGYSGNGGSTSTNPDHTFPGSGYYNVMLKVSYYDATLGKTCKDSIIKPVMVNKLRANFTYSIDSVNCTTVSFADSSEGGPTYIYWYFGNGGTAYGTNVTYKYLSNSAFNVTQMIYYYDSTTSTQYGDTITKQIDLSNCNACLISASIDLDGDSTIPYSGYLYNYSFGTINKHHWDFGDGSSSNLNTPVHSYANPGKYTITYIASDTIKNCTDTARVTFTIDSAGFLKRKAFVLTVIDRTTSDVKTIDKVEKTSLKCYPNPANNYFKLEGLSQRICIYDLKGSKIMTLDLRAHEILNVPTDGWPKGLYLIMGENRERLKLIVE